MNNWRPQNWRNNSQDMISVSYSDTRNYFKYGAERYEAGADAMLEAVIKWLDEPCTEHKTVVIGGSYNHGEIVKRLRCADHRRDCPECWQSIKELKI